MRWPTPPTGPDGAEIIFIRPRPATTPATEFGSHDQRSTAGVLIWRFLCPVGRVRQPLQPSLEGLPLPLTSGPVTSVSMSTRGHSHMRGLGAAGRVVRRERYRGSRNERGPVRAAHSAVAGSLLTQPSPARCSPTDTRGRGRVALARRREPPAARAPGASLVGV